MKRLSLYTGRPVPKVKPRERAFKQFKSPVLNVLNVQHEVSWTPANYFKNWNEGDTKDNDFESLLILLLKAKKATPNLQFFARALQ